MKEKTLVQVLANGDNHKNTYMRDLCGEWIGQKYKRKEKKIERSIKTKYKAKKKQLWIKKLFY